MLRYTMDVEERSSWLRCTPSAEERAGSFYCTEAGTFYARERFRTERSSKASHIVFYTLGGEGVISQGDQRVVLRRGQALLMDCRQPQSYGTAPGRHHWYHSWAHIDGGGVQALGKLLGLPALTPIEMDPQRARQCFESLESCIPNEDGTRPIRAGLAVHQLLATMALCERKELLSDERRGVDEARAFLEANYDRPINVGDAATAASLSTSQLIRQFKAHFGTTPHAYLLGYRITRAKELLTGTTLSVAEISRRVGFSSESNFSYRFGKMVGQSPSMYRASAPLLLATGDEAGGDGDYPASTYAEASDGSFDPGPDSHQRLNLNSESPM